MTTGRKRSQSKEAPLYRQMLRAWDALAFHRYSEEVKKEAVSNLRFIMGGNHPYNLNPLKFDAAPVKSDCLRAIAALDVRATAIGLSGKDLDFKWIVTQKQIPHEAYEFKQKFAKEDRIWAQFGGSEEDFLTLGFR